MKLPPANYLLSMYGAAGGGMQRWMLAVRPPACGVIRVCDQPAALVVRQVTSRHNTSSAFMSSSACRPHAWAQKKNFSSYVSVSRVWLGGNGACYGNHCRAFHAHGCQAAWSQKSGGTSIGTATALGCLCWFHRDMPCHAIPFGKKSPGYDNDHDEMVSLVVSCGFTLAFPEHIAAVLSPLRMASCSHSWQAQQFHHMMGTGTQSVPHAIHSGWPVPDWMRSLPGPCPIIAQALQTGIPELTRFPEGLYTVGGGSWFSRSESGGGPFAIGSIHSGWIDYYRVHIPVDLDGAYMAEL